MVFSSVTFLFFFLPAVLMLYLAAGAKCRNILLLAASLLFYAWGEGVYLVLMLASIGINYLGGRLIGAASSLSERRLWLILSVILNLLLLGYFKYANFIADNLNILLNTINLGSIELSPVRLPIGISFFTFQALSYIIDVFRKEVKPQGNVLNLALYISLFPQLIAGPIVRYHDIDKQISNRKTSIADLANGIERFIFGLSKKVLLANPVGEIAVRIFALPESELTTPLAWLGAVAYTLQIYFDFSGYSDMAIGLGRMFGFRFLENFNYPYISRSIREFWRRWHISLSTWFRDYVYIPLGGNRYGSIRTGIHLVTVFLLCGLWHGAAWTFVIWGLYHGLFLSIERTVIGKLLENLWSPIRVTITLLLVICGWVIFRSETLSEALNYLSIMWRIYPQQTMISTESLNNKELFELIAALVFALPILPWLSASFHNQQRQESRLFFILTTIGETIKFLALLALCYFSIISLAAGVYNPFIYFRF